MRHSAENAPGRLPSWLWGWGSHFISPSGRIMQEGGAGFQAKISSFLVRASPVLDDAY